MGPLKRIAARGLTYLLYSIAAVIGVLLGFLRTDTKGGSSGQLITDISVGNTAYADAPPAPCSGCNPLSCGGSSSTNCSTGSAGGCGGSG